MDVLTKNDLWNENVDGYLPVLLEIYNPDIVWTEEEKKEYKQEDSYIRVISDYNKVRYNGKVWLPCNFAFAKPDKEGTKIGNGTITITALDSRVRKVLKAIKLTSELKVVAMFAKKYLNDDETDFVYRFTRINSMPLQMNGASKTNVSATFNLVFNDSLGQNVPFEIATQDRTPAVNV